MVTANQSLIVPEGQRDHTFDLRILQIEAIYWRTRFGAAVDILEEGDLELIEEYIIPMLSDRSRKIRKEVHQKLCSLFGIWFPPFISFARKAMHLLMQRQY